MTGMTTLAPDGMDGSDASDEARRLRSLSSTVEPDPVWRANVGGDYDSRSDLSRTLCISIFHI